MPLTTVDPTTALVVIDLQAAILARATVHPTERITRNAGRLARGFRSHGLPVVLVTVAGSPATRTDQNPTGAAHRFPAEATVLCDDLDPQPGDLRITKHTWGAFTGTGLAERLTGLGVTQIVLAGISTSIGVESTARQAQELGLHVTIALDAVTDTSAEAHHNSVTRIFPRLAETGTTREILGLLDSTRR